MAKTSSIEKNKHRRKLVARYANKRAELKRVADDESLTLEERFQARLKLAALPRNSSARARSQPLRSDRAAARLLPQAEDVAHRAARSGVHGAGARHGQVELVRRAFEMTMSDPLGDMLTRIRNAQMRKSSKVSTPGSRLRQDVLDVLQTEGYIRGYSTVAFDNGRSEFEIELKYYDGEPVIREIKRVSKPGRRVYASVKDHSARRQRTGRVHPVDAEGRHVGCRGT